MFGKDVSFMQSTISTNSRINHVSDKLFQKKQEEGEENEQRINVGYQRLENLDEKFNLFFDTMESSVQGLKEKIIILKEQIQQRRENAEQFFDNQQETIYVLENQIQTDIQDLKQNLQECESINEKNLEEQKWKTSNEIMEQNNIQEQKLNDQIVGKIKLQVPDIQNRVNIEECQRQECDKMILDITASNLKKINGQITNQQKKASENSEKIFLEIKNHIQYLKSQISTEQQQRKTGEENILNSIQCMMNQFNQVEKQLQYLDQNTV